MSLNTNHSSDVLISTESQLIIQETWVTLFKVSKLNVNIALKLNIRFKITIYNTSYLKCKNET